MLHLRQYVNLEVDSLEAGVWVLLHLGQHANLEVVAHEEQLVVVLVEVVLVAPDGADGGRVERHSQLC